MIDINELRRLAQAATPGPWFSDARGNIWRRPPSDLYENGGSVAGDKPIAFAFGAVGWRGEGVTGYPVENNARLIAAANPSAVIELLGRLEAVEKDVALKEQVIDALGSELNAVANERDALRAKLGAVEKELEVERMRLAVCGVAALGYFNGCAKEYESSSLYDVMELRAKNEELRARI